METPDFFRCRLDAMLAPRHPLVAGAEEMLAKAAEAAVSMKAEAPADLEQVIVDTSVKEKDVAYPTDSRLLEGGRHKLVKITKQYSVAFGTDLCPRRQAASCALCSCQAVQAHA